MRWERGLLPSVVEPKADLARLTPSFGRVRERSAGLNPAADRSKWSPGSPKRWWCGIAADFSGGPPLRGSAQADGRMRWPYLSGLVADRAGQFTAWASCATASPSYQPESSQPFGSDRGDQVGRRCEPADDLLTRLARKLSEGNQSGLVHGDGISPLHSGLISTGGGPSLRLAQATNSCGASGRIAAGARVAARLDQAHGDPA